MCPTDRSVRLGKRRTDRALSQAYSQLAADVRARASFDDLLQHVRIRASRLLDPPPRDEHHPGVSALAHLARHRQAHVRRLADWPGCAGPWIAGVDSLAQHLLGSYRVPMFLSQAWYATGKYADAKRRWFVEHAAGASLRSLDLPLRLTRRMEGILLKSPRHLTIEQALRRAELLGLGAGRRLVDAVLAATPALGLDHGDFWSTVWAFLIANAERIEPAQIAPVIEFVHAVRHEPVQVDTEDGVVLREPPQPNFSLKGRTVASVFRLMEAWHAGLGSTTSALRWEPSRLRPMVLEIPHEDESRPATTWEVTELVNSAQLRAEGTALRHCVASYGINCWRGACRIWSLRRRLGSGIRPVATLEVSIARRAIVQARGFKNRYLTARERSLVAAWALRERLRMAV